MSDYMFMLESHLSSDQNRVVAEVQAAAAAADVSIFLTGGAMRDMLGGFRIRDLDFTLEGNALNLAKTIAEKTSARVLSLDEQRRSAELFFPGGVTAEIATATRARYGKPGSRPQISAASIHEDLRGRDFCMNSIALSLNRASRGLLLDPTNGLADLERREIRITSPYGFYDDPVRLVRLVRFRARLGFIVEEKTKAQYENARLAEIEKYIPKRTLFKELQQMSDEPNPADLIRALEQEGLLKLFSPALQGSKINASGLARLDKLRRVLPEGSTNRVVNFGPFLYVLAEKLTPKEKLGLAKATDMRKSERDSWLKLEQRARKLEQTLKSARLRTPSSIHRVLSQAPIDEITLLLYRPAAKPVPDRIRNYLQKYLPLAEEITDAEVEAAGAKPGTPKFRKLKEQMIALRVDGRTRKPAPKPIPEPVPVPMRGRPRSVL